MIPGYNIIQLLHEGKRFNVVRAIRLEDNANVVLKLSVQESLAKKDVMNIANEYCLAHQIESEYVIKYFSCSEYSPHKWMFVLEDIHGVSLASIIPPNGFEVDIFLKIAMKVILGLQATHQKEIIHKDIKPSNIIINMNSGCVKIADFSCAIQLRQENQLGVSLSLEAGTLAYISPEQTGRINRNIDYRTDFYSLGITFYELLVGKVPFSGPDAMGIIHQHIAKQAIEPYHIKESIPLYLSQVIMKLIAKNPEERYQSCQGILYDLQQCLEALQKHETIPLSALGKQDFPEKFTIPQKLYGRENEIQTLLKTFDRASLGKAEVLMLTGFAGIGKTALVNEIHKPLTLKNGYFISGKFDQLHKGTAYHAIIQAFQGLIKQLLAETETRFNYWKEQLQRAIGTNAQLIVNVIPDVERIIGKQPSVPELGPTEAKNRFNLVFKNFISVFIQKDHPLALFLDDLQWADFASLELIKLFFSDLETQHFCLIGAYRDNEVDDLHPTALALEEIKRSHITINKIRMFPLNLQAVERWLADATNCALSDITPLAELVYQKTQGNPFFIKMFLQALYDENLLTAAATKQWQWNLQEIRKRQATDNVAEFMVSCIYRLPENTQQLLMMASCFGHHVSVNLLALVLQKDESQLLRDLEIVLNMGMAYRDEDNICFAHDRVQEAAYSLLSDDKKKQMHLLIGRLMLKNELVLIRPDAIFDIVDHLNKAYELVEDSKERLNLVKLNFEAAKKAKNAIAYQSALIYLNACLAYLNQFNLWSDDYAFAFALYKELAEAEYLNGNFEKSYSVIQQIITRLNNPIDIAEINLLLLIQKTLIADYQEAINIGRHSLNLLREELPTVDLKAHIQNEQLQIKEQLQNRPINTLLDLSAMANAEKIALMKILFNLLTPTYMADPDLYFLVALKMVNLSLKYGHVPEAGISYGTYGLMLCKSGECLRGYEFANLGIKLSEKFHNARAKCRVLATYVNFICHWAIPVSVSSIKKIFEEGFQLGLQTGELQYAGFFSHGMVLDSYYLGDFLTSVSLEANKQLAFVEKTKNQISIDTIKAVQLAVSFLTNPLTKTNTELTNIIKASDFEKNCIEHNSHFALCLHYSLKAQLHYLMGHYVQALDNILRAENNVNYVSGIIMNVAHTMYYSLILIKQYSEQDTEAKKSYLSQLEKNQKQLQSWAESCPDNFQHCYILVEAELANINHKRWEALELYNQAIQLAHDHKFIHDEALANELAANFLNVNNQKRLAKDYMQKAHALYKHWGAAAKVQQLEKYYPELFFIVPIPHAYEHLVSSCDESYINLDRLNLETVLKASQIISSEVDLNKFLHTMMATMLEHAGAEKVAFFAIDGEHIILIAQSYDHQFDFNTLAINDWQNGSSAIVQYIRRTKCPLIIDNACKDSKFRTDEYIQKQQIKSILCLPIIIKDELKAILYLENNLTSNAFTSYHLEILAILTNQIAISLENANLYQAKQKDERRYRTLVAASNAVVWLANNIGHFITPQESWAQFTGQSWEQYQGLGWVAAIHPDDQERILTELKQAITTKVYFRELIRVWSCEGFYKYLIMRAVPLLNEYGEIIEVMGAGLDVHAIKQTEEQLRAMTDNLNLALSSANIGTWSLDLVSNKIDIDENIFALFDIDSSTYHHTLDEVFLSIHPEDRDHIKAIIDRCISEHSDYEAEYRIIRKDKSIHYISARGKVYCKDNKPIRMTGSVWDITLEKERQHLQEVKRYQQKLEEFIDTLCHELRNPLTGIYGGTDLLRGIIDSIEALLQAHYDKLNPTTVEKLYENFKQAKEQLDTLEICARQQKVIVDDVLDLSKIDNNKIELAPKAFSLTALISSLIQIIIPQVTKKKLKIKCVLPEGDCLLKADAQRLSQIIINLLTNAIKFTDEGSISIVASLKEIQAPEMLLSITVKDTGIGMTLEEQARLFQRFAQASRATSHEYGGSGLGLVISKKLVEKMGGTITVESERGHGSQFHFTVKCHALTAEEKIEFYKNMQESSLTTEITLAEKKQKTILIVEDNILNKKILENYLKLKGYFYQIANDGVEALEKCEELFFDLILMDIEMPRMNGLEATRKIRSQDTNKNYKTPIVGLSGNARKEQIETALNAGMNDYLTKPYHKVDVYKIIDKYLQAMPTKTCAVTIQDAQPANESIRLSHSLVKNSFWNPNRSSLRQSLYQEKQVKSWLNDEIPSYYQLGAAISHGDCFFDALAQGLNQRYGKDEYSVKSLRLLCDEYAKKSENTWVRSANLADREDPDNYLVRIQFTADELLAKERAGFKIGIATWGRPRIEGRIFCEHFGIRIHVIEIQEDGSIHRYLIDKTGEKEDYNPKINYNDPNILYIVNYHNHFVPLIRNNKYDFIAKVFGGIETISGHRTGQYQGSDVVFDIFKTRTDSKDKFFGLPVPYDRAGVVGLLMEQIANAHIRSLIATEVMESIRTDCLSHQFYTQFHKLNECKIFQTKIDKAQNTLLQQICAQIKLPMVCRQKQFEFVLEYLQTKPEKTNIENDCLESLLKFQQDNQAEYNEFKTFCQNEAVLRSFLQEHIAKEGNLSFTVGGINFGQGSSFLDAIIECMQPPIRLIIWEDDPEEADKVKITYEGGSVLGEVTHVYYRKGLDSYFSPMAETKRSLCSLIPSLGAFFQSTATGTTLSDTAVEKTKLEGAQASDANQDKHNDNQAAQIQRSESNRSCLT